MGRPKGVIFTEEHKKNISKGMLGKPHPRKARPYPSAETRRKLGDTNRGKHLPEATRRKISAKVKGEKNPNYRHGRKIDPRPGIWAELRKRVIERDKYCQLCLTKENLAGHHINGDGQDHQFDNITTLCRVCHGLLHAIARRWRGIRFDFAKDLAKILQLGLRPSQDRRDFISFWNGIKGDKIF